MFPWFWFFGPDDAAVAAVMLLVCFLIALPLALVYHGCGEASGSDAAQAAMAAGSQPAVVRMCPDCAHRLTCQECGRPLPSHTKDQQK